MITFLWIVKLVMSGASWLDVWKMAKSEIPYWYIIKEAIANETEETKKRLEAEKDKASTQASRSQFGVIYACLFLALLGATIEGWIYWLMSVHIFAAVLFLHYAGAEDLGYFIRANFLKLPEKWWMDRVYVGGETRICGLRMPALLFWLAETKKVLWFNIKPRWIIAFGGDKVEVRGFIKGVIIAWIIVVASGALWLLR